MGTRKKAYHNSVDRVLNRRAYRNVVCVSNSQRDRAIARDALRPNQAVVIYNGVDPARFQSAGRNRELARSIGLDPSRPVIGTVGRLIEEKGHRVLVAAMLEITRRIPGVQFLIVGDGPLRGELERAARDAGGHLIVTGLRSDVPDLLRTMDVFVFPSWSEAFGIAVIEAMAAGVPVVCSQIPALAEIVDDGVNGLLFECGNAGALASRVSDVLSDDGLVARLTSGGCATVQRRFTESHMIQQYEGLYRSLAGVASKLPAAKAESDGTAASPS